MASADKPRGVFRCRRMLYQLARLSAHLPGDIAECGCFQGAGSYLICAVNAAAGNQRIHRLFESFADRPERMVSLSGGGG